MTMGRMVGIFMLAQRMSRHASIGGMQHPRKRVVVCPHSLVTINISRATMFGAQLRNACPMLGRGTHMRLGLRVTIRKGQKEQNVSVDMTLANVHRKNQKISQLGCVEGLA